MSGPNKQQIESLWFQGDGVKAGEMIYKAIPEEKRPRWAALLLQLCCSRVMPGPEVENVYLTALRRSKWKYGHDAFDKVRDLTLKYEKSVSRKHLYGALLYLTECVAKVTYNASGESASFDEDSGWWVSENLRHFCQVLGDECFERAAFNMLISPLIE
jgi:hypothetical protein